MAEPSLPTIKRLFIESGRRCAFPGCETPLVLESGEIIGEICHIRARNARGPRHDPNQSEAQRQGYDNLLLLCPTHHSVIDAQPAAYTVEVLQEMKAQAIANLDGTERPSDRIFAGGLLGKLHDVVINDNQGNIAINSPGAIQAGTLVVKSTRGTTKINPPPGSIGADGDARRYVKLIDGDTHVPTHVRVTEVNTDFTSVYRSFTMFANMMRSLPARLDALPWAHLALPLTATEDAVARLDERLRGSIIRDGWTARTHFADTISSLALDGELVQLDDLVLHDSRLDVRAPSPELTCAHALLRLRRRIAGMDPQSAATAAGIAALIGRRYLIDDDSPTRADGETNEASAELDRDDGDAWATTLATVDAVLARTDRLLAQPALGAPPLPGSLVRRHDPDRGARLARWIATVEDTDTLPPVLAAARALVAWDQLDPLPDDAGLGRLLAGNLLRARGKTTSHLAAISLGLRTVQPERRRHRDPVVRLLAVVDAIAAAAARGLKDHDRRLTAREALLRRIGKRRGNSKLPKLVELVIAAPLVTTDMIATELSVTHRAALDMIAILDLREVTGRGRYRAWSIT